MTALHMLQISVTVSLFLLIARATSSKQAWEILKEEFGETNDIRDRKASNLRTKFRGMMMEKEESVVVYTKKLMEVVHQLKFDGSDISDEEVIHKICCSLTSRFDGIVRSICGACERGNSIQMSVRREKLRTTTTREGDNRELFQAIFYAVSEKQFRK